MEVPMKKSRAIAWLAIAAALVLGSCDLFKIPQAATTVPAGTNATAVDANVNNNEWLETDATLNLSGPVGTWYKITVGAKPSGQSFGNVWGSNPYTGDSSLAAAAVHAGAITTAGGTFYIKIVPGQQSYYASTANDITTIEWGYWERAFTVYKP
jgi:hypothetical protein